MGRKPLIAQKIKPQDKFGDWTVIRIESQKNGEQTHAWCKCKCGEEASVNIYNLYRGKSTKCRICSNAEIRQRRQKKIRLLLSTNKNKKGNISPQIDIHPGDQFGKWTVIKKIKIDGKRPESITKGYLCICQCGNTAIVPKNNLINGGSTQCKRCASRERVLKVTGSHYKKTDIIGKRYGQLVVTGREGMKFICRCDCGKSCLTTKNALKNGKTDCGHTLKEQRMNKRIGEKYGRLTVLSRAEDKIFANGRRQIMYICQCDCGNIITVSNSNLLCHNTTSCGCYKKEKIRKNSFKLKYTPEMEQEILDRNNPAKELAVKYGVSEQTIRCKRRELEKARGIKSLRKWTKEMDELVLQRPVPDKELAKQLGVTYRALHSRRSRLVRGVNY